MREREQCNTQGTTSGDDTRYGTHTQRRVEGDAAATEHVAHTRMNHQKGWNIHMYTQQMQAAKLHKGKGGRVTKVEGEMDKSRELNRLPAHQREPYISNQEQLNKELIPRTKAKV